MRVWQERELLLREQTEELRNSTLVSFFLLLIRKQPLEAEKHGYDERIDGEFCLKAFKNGNNDMHYLFNFFSFVKENQRDLGFCIV